VLGALLAVLSGHVVNLFSLLWGFGILLSAYISMSYTNHYYDTDVDRYNSPTLFSGGSGGLLDNLRLRAFLRRLSLFFLIVSNMFAFLFIIVFSVSLVFFFYVLIGNFLAFYYTAPPLKFVYRGFGELIVMITVGLMTPGLGYFIVARQFDVFFFLFVIPLLLYTLVIIINVEIPDVDGDRQSNKKTMIVRKGRCFGFFATGLLLFLATFYFFILSLLNIQPRIINFHLITLFSLVPFCLGIVSLLKRSADQMLAVQIVNKNISSLFFLVILINSYFLFLVFS
jgi:1,4-dihydroxy-2-naphthoate octaprenyltransferase